MNRYRRATLEEFKKIKRPGWAVGVKEALNGEVNIGTDQEPEYVSIRSRITLAGRPVHSAGKKAHLVDRAADLLRSTKFSLWEHEAAVYHGFRAGMVLDGENWQRAADEAADIVRRAFNKLGRGVERRPTADQARDEYYVPAENCVVCYRPLEPDDIGKTRFCSMEHAKFQYFKRLYAGNKEDSEFALAARKLVYREKFGKKVCASVSCRHEFWPSSEDQKFCSPACLYESQRVRYDKRECALDGCTTMFVPKYQDQRYCCQNHGAKANKTVSAKQCARDGCDVWFTPKHRAEVGSRRGTYCSPACAIDDRSSLVYDLECQACGDPFTAAMSNASYCSETCRQIVRKYKRGQPPKRLSPKVFDFLFNALNAAEPPKSGITDHLFDQAA